MAYKRSHLSARTRAYTKAGSWAFEVIVGADPERADEEPPSEHEYGWKPVWLKLMGTRSIKPFWMSLTGMTLEELEAFKKIMDIAYKSAREAVEDLDRQAIEVMMKPDADDIPMRALASAPPWYDRDIPSRYETVGDFLGRIEEQSGPSLTADDHRKIALDD